MRSINILLLLTIPLYSCSGNKLNDSSKIFFIKEQPPKNGQAYYSRAQMVGKLILKDGCFFLENSNSSISLLIWPWDYSYITIENRIIFMDENNAPVTALNSNVHFSGDQRPMNYLSYNYSKSLINFKKCSTKTDNVTFVGKQFKNLH